MATIFKIITKNLSLRISLIVVGGLALLTVTLVGMFHFAHQALKEEAMSNAQQTLDGTVQQIDNILLSVEQTTGNVYYDLMRHLNEPERMMTYSRRLVKSNKYIVGCAIVFKPDYYPGHHLYMAYIHRKGHSVTTDETSVLVAQNTYTDKPYTEQRWYTEPMKSGKACWIDPLKNDEAEDEALTTFCLPIYDRSRQVVGVVAVDVSIALLSEIILAVKPSPNGYATMLARNGSFIVHPDEDKLLRQTVFEQMHVGADPSVLDAAEAMVSGQTGHKPFTMNGKQWRVFYKPFKRTEVPGRVNEQLEWSVGVIYPVDDIYGDYNRLFHYLLIAATIAVLILFVTCWVVTRQQLKPLEILTQSAQHIADGNYDEPLPDTKREDEIGQLQENFRKVLRSLKIFMRRQDTLNSTLKDRGEVLADAYNNVQKSNKIKAAFLHYMTNQMVDPAEKLDKSVTTLCNEYHSMTLAEANNTVEEIEQQSDAIVKLTDQMLQTAQDEEGKGGEG